MAVGDEPSEGGAVGRPRTVVVIGAAGGIGAASARLLAADGWHVVAADIASCEDTVKAVADTGGSAEARELDLADVDASRALLAEPALDRLGAVVIAAALMGPLVPIEEYPVAEWERVVAVNLTGTFFCAQAAANRLASTGGGRLVLFSSPAGRTPAKTTIAPYTATKAAVVPLVSMLATAYAPRGVLVASVEPGRTETPMISGPVYPEGRIPLLPDMPLGRVLQPEEIAEVVRFLCSPAAGGVTNANWPVSSRL